MSLKLHFDCFIAKSKKVNILANHLAFLAVNIHSRETLKCLNTEFKSVQLYGS